MARGLTRRGFLSASLRAGAGGVVLLSLSCRSQRGGASTALVELSHGFRDLDGVARVGAEALAVLPEGEGTDVDALLARIAPERGGAALRDEIRDQHGRGETLSLRGWPLALTEARLYALVALARREGML